ncbi:MAG: hypothetical protein EWV82_14705 [Microcystis aeruginosa Ma_AC_P_19900807_S299]|nr:MAG: hypothetical protein EWV82_14705 [Microcystis aeruginosa Ma_AC_P_19900807_S299]
MVLFPPAPCPLPPADRLFQVSPDEKIFTPTDERGFLPYTPHPTPHTLFPVLSISRIFLNKKRRNLKKGETIDRYSFERRN